MQKTPENWWIEFVKDNKFEDSLWKIVSSFQDLSEPFIERHFDKVDFDMISKHQKLSEEFKEKIFVSINNFFENM